MSKYRDDSSDTAVASSETWLGVLAITEEVARTATAALVGLMVLTADAVTASDTVADTQRPILAEAARVSELASDRLLARTSLAASAAIGEEWRAALRSQVEEGARAADDTAHATRAGLFDAALAGDSISARKRVSMTLAESARVGEAVFQAATARIEEAAAIADEAVGRLRAASLVADGATVADELADAQHGAVVPLDSAATAREAIIDALRARDVLTDGATVEDAALQDDAGGQAWTAGAGNWAMSRYAPYAFNSLAVIDGTLYATAADGVYALDGGEADTVARIETGKLDIGRGMLAHLSNAYMEYSLEGEAHMSVTQTQDGTARTYTYALPQKSAGELTNGRFTFGRGLRGRHFAFALTLTGSRASINDLRILSAQTKRRI